MNDGNAEVRNEAVWYLGNRRDPGTVDALMEHFKKEENLAVKRQIIDALEKICNLDGHNIRYHDLGFVEKPKVLEILRFLENVFGGSEEDEIVREKAKDAFNTIERTNFR